MPEEAQLSSVTASRADRELDDARYYLRRGCLPCAERHLDLARRRGAREEEIEAVRAAAPATFAPRPAADRPG